jgi:amino-acid N-acetyltransferase
MTDEIVVRAGAIADVPDIDALIDANLAEGHLLPRTAEDLTRNAHRFLVATVGGHVVGCAELAPLSRAVAEVRSLVVDAQCRGRGLGSQLVEELKRAARRDGFSTLCAFTHQPSHFIRHGFSMVPHPWLPEKLSTDCYNCPKFRTCGQYAMALSLTGGSIRSAASGQRPYLAMPPSAMPLRLVSSNGTTTTAQGDNAAAGQAKEAGESGRIQ